MEATTVFGLQFLLSLVAWSAAFAFLVNPALAGLDRRRALMWLALPHTFRHVGLVFLVPGVVDRPLREGFALPAAYGDLATGLLALLALFALHYRWSAAIQLVWAYGVVGVLDLARALGQADVIPGFGAAWYIPTMLVPLLLVTHVLTFRRLLAPETGRESRPGSVSTLSAGRSG